MQTKRALWLMIASLLLIGSAIACSEVQAGPRAWIDYPTDGAHVPVGTPVAVLSHVYAREGVTEVLLSVNRQPYRRDAPANPGETLSDATHEWLPQQEGEYVLEVRAYSKSGDASNPATVRVIADRQTEITPTPVPGPTTPVGMPDLAIVGVEAVVAGYKDTTPFCNTRVTFRNAGTAPVPRDYAIQFLFNGTLTFTNTVAGGLLPGATDQIIFVYQFVGSATIGANLDSANVIAESNEANNGFSNALACGGPTPVPPTPTFTPTLATRTLTPTPTRTPTPVTPPPPAGCSGSPAIASFNVSPSTIQAGQSATLSWGAVTNADSVFIEPGLGGVGTPGSMSVSPGQTTTYTLVAQCGDVRVKRQVVLTVTTPKPPDRQGPPAPGLVAPSGSIQCSSSITLDWNAVKDESGIKNYTVKWVRDGKYTGGTVTTGTSANVSVTCDNKSHNYTWSVFATDNANNQGDTANGSFTLEAGLY